MSNLQITLSIVGVLLIIAIIGHGIWTMRKNNQQFKAQSQTIAKKRTAAQSGGFDDDGIGKVRVVKKSTEEGDEHPASQAQEDTAAEQPANQETSPKAAAEAEQMSMNLDLEDAEQAPLPSMRVDRDDATVTDNTIVGQAELDLPEDEQEQATSSAQPATESQSEAEPAPEPESEAESETEQPPQQPAEEVISLFVKGNVQGAVLLQMMTELGCKFGDMGIFHRFEQTSGNGPMIFSVANMFNPGTFDLDNIENFETDGVALFMTLPLNYDGQQAFNMMLNAAKKLAMEIPQGQVLDGQRQLLSRQSIQQAHQRIREFEKPSS